MSKAESPQPPAGQNPDGEARLSRASVARFSLYLRCVQQLRDNGVATVSSSQLGEALGITDAQVRKDLACLGNLGHRGVGYPTHEVAAALRSVLGVDRPWSVVLVGVGNLARALLRYSGFRQQGFNIVALFDVDPTKVGQNVEGLPVFPTTAIARVVAETHAELAVVTVPSEVAQEVADSLAAAGIRGILNFAPVVLRLPPTVRLVAVDLAVQLEQLASLVHLGANE
jgi:redox-sensing transcriptional repressor